MIEINNLHFSYTGKHPYILENVNLNIHRGDYISVVGENGSSKSTLVKLILTLLKPCSGKINLHTSKIGYVPQRGENFNSEFPITVEEILRFHQKVLKRKEKNLIKDSLSLVGMENFKKHLIGNLSGGQQQKVFIARAIMGNPDIIILDEPSTGIDTKSQRDIYSFLKDLNIKIGTTILSVEHNIDAVLKYSTHVIRMDRGSAYFYNISDYKRYLNDSKKHDPNCDCLKLVNK